MPRSRRALFVLAAISSGCGRAAFDVEGARDLTFVDDDQAAFDLGTYDAGSVPLHWETDRLTFASAPPYAPAEAGIYLSRTFDSRSPTTRWNTLSWLPVAPQGKALPDTGGMDVGYAEAGVDMRGNILLLHLDGAGSLADGDTITDSSGASHHGRFVQDGQGGQHIAGAFADALDIERDAWISLDGNYFDFGTGDFTYAIWVRMFPCADSNDNRIALGGAGAGDTPHMWLGALCPDACGNLDGAFMNFLDSSRVGPSLNTCTGVVLQDGAWHHLAGVKQGHAASTVRLYVDGREVASTTFAFGATTFDYDAGEIRIGSFNLSDPQYHTRITADEAAIWKRALDASEIAALYRRGATDLGLQIRVCPDRVCDTEPFVGPDGTSATYFTEADLTGAAGEQDGNLAALDLVGPVAQYRARFTTSASQLAPGLVSVSLQAHRP